MKQALVVYLIGFLAACGQEAEKEVSTNELESHVKVIASGVRGSVVLMKVMPLNGFNSIRILTVDQDGEFAFSDEMRPGAAYAVSVYSDTSEGNCEVRQAGGFFPSAGPVILNCE